MKKIYLFLLLGLSICLHTGAQTNNHMRFSGDVGIVVNSAQNNKSGVGGTISWLTADIFLFKEWNNYFTLHLKGFNNPYGDGKLFSSILNDENDGFNYIMPLAGYRMTRKGITEGFYLEPRIGVIIGASDYVGLAISPMTGYTFGNFDASLYVDIGFGNKVSAIHKKNIFAPGISIGYIFPLF